MWKDRKHCGNTVWKGLCLSRHLYWKSTGVTNKNKTSSVIFRFPSQPWQCDSEPACTIPETEAAKWTWLCPNLLSFISVSCCDISKAYRQSLDDGMGNLATPDKSVGTEWSLEGIQWPCLNFLSCFWHLAVLSRVSCLLMWALRWPKLPVFTPDVIMWDVHS